MSNLVELDPKDNRGLYINGVKVEEVSEFSIDMNGGVLIRFNAEVSVHEPTNKG